MPAREQDGDAEPNPRKEAREDALAERQADCGFQRACARPQNQIREEHAANPDGSQSVECNSNRPTQLFPDLNSGREKWMREPLVRLAIIGCNPVVNQCPVF